LRRLEGRLGGEIHLLKFIETNYKLWGGKDGDILGSSGGIFSNIKTEGEKAEIKSLFSAGAGSDHILILRLGG